MICVGELVFVRTQSFSVLFFGLLLWLLARDDGRLERRVLLALPLLVLWANLHAAVLVGAAVCVLYAVACLVESRARSRRVVTRALVLAVGACAACLASPVGAELPGYLRQTVENDDFRRFVSEWQPVTLSSSPLFVVAALGACAIAACAPIPRRDRFLVWALTLAGFTRDPLGALGRARLARRPAGSPRGHAPALERSAASHRRGRPRGDRPGLSVHRGRARRP